MARSKVIYRCSECGYESIGWLGRCPDCGSWNTFEEKPREVKRGNIGEGSNQPVPISKVQADSRNRYLTSLSEFDRVLGGGIVPGSLILIGGDPGIGKSTLLLQVSDKLSKRYSPVLYVSGEESAQQTKLRGIRLSILSEKLYVMAETDIRIIGNAIISLNPKVVVIDSIQSVYDPDLSSSPGSVSQVRGCTSRLMAYAKNNNISIFIVGHVTKEGIIAGPRLVEHIVDAVLYFEGDRHYIYRILRAVKNRFGSSNEIGLFEMREQGLVEVPNPSQIFLAERPEQVSGSVVVSSLEGTRPLLVEIQALVSTASFTSPRRMTTGVDYNRICLILAVLEKRVGLSIADQDVYVNVAGGMRIDEPAADLGAAVAIASSFKDMMVDPEVVLCGEVGLAGEVRAVGQVEKRIREAVKLGFRRCIISEGNMKGLNLDDGIQVLGVKNVQQALEYALLD